MDNTVGGLCFRRTSRRIEMVSLRCPRITESRRNWNSRCHRPPFSRHPSSGDLRGRALRKPCSQRSGVIVRHLLQNETFTSRRALLRGIVSSASVLALGGCASLGATGARYDAASLSVGPTLLVATTRKPVNGGRTKPWFGPERATRMTVGRAKLVPPDESRFSLAAAGIGDWGLHGGEPGAGGGRDLSNQAGGGGGVLMLRAGFKQAFAP